MKKRNLFWVAVLFLAAVLGGTLPIFAAEETSSMMCDQGIVNIGDADVDVQDKCGQPNEQSMDEWVYNFGPSEPVYSVVFKDGKVAHILESESGN